MPSSSTTAIDRRVRAIVADVRRRGDAALVSWARRLDGIEPPFELSPAQVRAGWNATPRDVRRAIALAVRHVRRVAERQLPKPFALQVRAGVRVEQRVEPFRRVACYVPGGRFPLPSTVVMTVVPARVAGVSDVDVYCPSVSPAVLAAALESGATRVYRLGGAQAIAAAAFGTRTIPRADKIVGPGNVWVAAAKREVSEDCAIDFRAGPSEIVIWSDRGRADWIAADLAAQAEHDPRARAVLITTRGRLLEDVRRELTRSGLRLKNVTLAKARNRREAADFVNEIAPEHLVCDNDADARQCGAGTIFVGRWSAQAAGDYATGSNHVLPTGGTARFRGGLSAADFVRVFSVQTITPRGLRAIAPSIVALAEAEGLYAHARSIRVRLGDADATRAR